MEESEVGNCIWGVGVSATVQMSHLMQLINFSLQNCVVAIYYLFLGNLLLVVANVQNICWM